MSPLVFFEIATSNKSMLALIAGKWPLAGVLKLVHGEFALRRASIFAVIANERTLTRMNADLVSSKGAAFCGSIFAFIACEWPLTRMRTFVSNQVDASSKSMVALDAGEWALAEVRTFVSTE